jgi:hypothetical protein
MATKHANQVLATRGFIPTMEIGEMPEVKIQHWNLISQNRDWDFESDSIEQLKLDAMNYAERHNVDLNDCQAQALGFGYDVDENEVVIVEAL